MMEAVAADHGVKCRGAKRQFVNAAAQKSCVAPAPALGPGARLREHRAGEIKSPGASRARSERQRERARPAGHVERESFFRRDPSGQQHAREPLAFARAAILHEFGELVGGAREALANQIEMFLLVSRHSAAS